MEALDSWELELALKVACPRCDAPAGERCVVPHEDYGVVGSPSPHIHPMRMNAYYAADIDAAYSNAFASEIAEHKYWRDHPDAGVIGAKSRAVYPGAPEAKPDMQVLRDVPAGEVKS